MCGLVGVAGDLHSKDLDVLKDLLACSYVRGADATGVAGYSIKSKDLEIYKYASDPVAFLSHRKADRVMSVQNDVLMGHTRRAAGVTWDSKFSHDDAHPFYWNNVVGAHNGVVKDEAIEALPHRLKGAIDSENIVYSISKIGVEETLSKIYGAWALSLLDVEKQKLAFVRNSQRPLSFAFSKDKKVLYWASEWGMLSWVLARWGVELAEDIKVLPENTLLTFDLASKKPIYEAWEMSKAPEGKEPEKKSTPTVVTHRRTAGRSGTSSKDKTTEDIFLDSLKNLETQLFNFDYSKRKTWGPKKTRRHRGLVKAIERMYVTWENWGEDPKVDIKAIEAPTSGGAVIIPMTQLIKAKLGSDGCALCCKSTVPDNQLDSCVIGRSGEVLCPECADDDVNRSIIQAQPLKTKLQKDLQTHEHH